MVEFTVATASIRQSLYATLLDFWNQKWDPDFFEQFLDWRYARRLHGETLVAMSGDKCLAMVDTFVRPYRVGSEEILVREPCDWFCRPAHRGLGMRMMRFLNQQGEPLLGVGLPDAAISISRRMNWVHLTDTRDFVLRLTVRQIAAAVVRRLKLGEGSIAECIPAGLHIRSRRSWVSHNQAGGEVRELTPEPEDWDEFPSTSSYDLLPVFTREYFEWLQSGPAPLGQVFGLGFRQADRAVGFTVCRIESSLFGKKAKIIHIHANHPNITTLRWMIAESISRAIDLEAESVQCRSSCQITHAALESLGFGAKGREAVMIGFGPRPTPTGAANITLLRGDDAMIPNLIGA